MNQTANRSRVWRSKAKTGCITCKARRVKCDETKPSCRQCCRLRRICGGYQEPEERHKKASAPLPPPVLLPKRLLCLKPLALLPANHRFQDSQEDLCFRYFCSSTSTSLSGSWETDLWSRLIPQASETNSSIRHVVIAIGALSLISKHTNSSDQKQAEIYHQFALRQYSKALLQMQIATSHGNQDIRSALISSIVIICFEAFYGSHESALSQLGATLGLLNAWLGQHHTVTGVPPKLSMSTSCNIEKEIIEAYARLDIHVMMLQMSRSSSNRIILTKTALVGKTITPSCFTSVEEARNHILTIQRQLLDMLNSNTGVTVPMIEEFSIDTPRETMFTLFREREDLLNKLVEWHIAFDPILQRVRGDKSGKESRAALILYLHYLTSYFSIAHLPSKTQMRRRDFMPLFAEMISLSRSIIQHPDSSGSTFTFDSEIVKPLYTVACQCPNITLRRQAISMLLSAPRREGFWDAALSGKLAQWVTTLEEEDIEGNYLPEETKIRNLRVEADLKNRTAKAECLKPEKVFPDRVASRSTVINW